jgi:hypothetical protein
VRTCSELHFVKIDGQDRVKRCGRPSVRAFSIDGLCQPCIDARIKNNARIEAENKAAVEGTGIPSSDLGKFVYFTVLHPFISLIGIVGVASSAFGKRKK